LKEQVMKQMPNQQVDPSVMEMFSQMAAFDCVPLLKTTKEMHYVGVNLYVDDQGVAKGLGLNRRATSVAFAVGTPIQILGDAFIARLVDDSKDLFQRLDFTIDDLKEEAAWIRAAKEIHQKAPSKDEATEKIKEMLGAKTKAKSCARPECRGMTTTRCSRCKKVYYCSRVCQKADWKTHKEQCLPAT